MTCHILDFQPGPFNYTNCNLSISPFPFNHPPPIQPELLDIPSLEVSTCYIAFRLTSKQIKSSLGEETSKRKHTHEYQLLPALNQALVQAAQMTGQILVSVPLEAC